MCIDPASAAIIATVAGGAMSAAGQLAEGNASGALGKAQRDSYYAQADVEAKTSGYQASREYDKQVLEDANARAQVGASGVALTGSPVEALAENAAQGQLDLEAIKWSSNLKQQQLRTQGQVAKMQGDAAKKSSRLNALGTMFSAASSAFGMKAGNSFKVGGSPFSKPGQPMNLLKFT